MKIPHSQELEETILSAILADGGKESIPMLLDVGCKPEWWYKTETQIIWEHISDLYSKNENVDEVSLGEALATSESLTKVGGYAYLARIGSIVDVCIEGILSGWIRRLQGYAILRDSVRLGAVVIENARDTRAEDAEAFLAQIESDIYTLSKSIDQAKHFEHISSSADQALKRINAAIESGGKSVGGINFGLREIDAITKGLKPSELTVLAARPSVGKTAIATMLVDQLSIPNGQPSLIFSIETRAAMLTQRMICARARVNFDRIQDGFCTPQERERINKATAEIRAAPIHIDDTPRISVSLMAARARRLASKLGSLPLIVIDYLQLIEPPAASAKAPMEERIAATSRELKILNNEIGCHVLLLAQLNRDSVRENRPPKTSDLRGSGAIEQDADVIMFLYRPTWDQAAPEELVNIDIHKHRNGRTSDRPGRLHFNRRIGEFTDFASPHDEAQAEVYAQARADNNQQYGRWARNPTGED